MPGLLEDKDGRSMARNFTVESQNLEIEIDFQKRTITGRTEIRIQPHSKESRTIGLQCRQCKVTSVKVDGKGPQSWKHIDPYHSLTPRPGSTVYQHHQLRSKIGPQLQSNPASDLIITLPKSVQIRESYDYSGSSLPRGADGPSPSADLGENNTAAGRFSSLTIEIYFEANDMRDGLQWVGGDRDDFRWPHVYTKNSPYSGSACSLFPCVDDLRSRHPWNISLKCPRTLGDAFPRETSSIPSAGNRRNTSDIEGAVATPSDWRGSMEENLNGLGLSEQESEMELAVACSGELTDEIVEHPDSTWKTVSFVVHSSVSANQVGFAIGPFEDIDLSDLREIDEDERLGEQAVRVHAFCLPGRAAEVRSACMPLAKAVDFFTTTYTTYTGESWNLCFVDDLICDTTDTAALSICSTRLLFPEEILDTLYPATRTLVHALAAQYAGINMVPKTPEDSWLIAGISAFMTDSFMKSLCGNNEYRFRHKLAADRVFELDVERPSIYDLGAVLHLDRSEAEFVAMKAGVVLFILDRRLFKMSGSTGVVRIIGRVLNEAKVEEFESSFLSTAQFKRVVFKMGHVDLDSFLNQWVFGAGCPIFEVTQTFNKKKLCVTTLINQVQGERTQTGKALDSNTFLRDVKEEATGIPKGPSQLLFTGPMTIRIHEADGTPYEHIVDITKAKMTVDIPYNNKYKRKKSKKQKERTTTVSAAEPGADGADVQDDVLLYSLGDVLQSQEDMADWRLIDWTKEMEEKMNDESYEWVRMDADFEWICKISIHMPAYMWVSQLQQDRDVVAQMESLQWVKSEVEKRVHPLTATFLIRTLLDGRYFHGIRTMAASLLSSCAKAEVDWVGLFQLEKAFQELFCFNGSAMTRPNDFSDRITYLVQCAILRSLSNVKDDAGRVPPSVKKLFMEKLKLNDNTKNEYSDCYYIATLLQCLAESLMGPGIDGNDEAEIEAHLFEKQALAQINRYRRVDEWSSSYQNIITTTTLDCLTQLSKAKITEPKLGELLQYTRSENSDQVRIKAYDCLVELGALRNKAIMRYILYEMSHDRSPYIRENIFRTFAKALGKLAIGDEFKEKEEPANDGLVLEKEESSSAINAKQTILARKQTTDGALAALKAELDEDESFKKALWSAVSSPVMSFHEVSNLLDLCAILFEPRNSLLLKFNMPRYWRLRHDGSGKLTFTPTDKVRWQPLKPLQPLATKPESSSVAAGETELTTPNLKRKESSSEMNGPGAAKKPRPITTAPTIKLKARLSEITGPDPAKTVEVPSPSVKQKESASEMNDAGPTKKARAATVKSPSATPAPSLEGKRTILKLKIGPRITEAPSGSSPNITTSGAPPNGAHMGYGPVNSTTAAPLGYGRITASPTTVKSPISAPMPGLVVPSAKGMSPPPRPPSAASASTTTSSNKRRKSSTPQPPTATSPREDLEDSLNQRRSSQPRSARTSRQPTPLQRNAVDPEPGDLNSIPNGSAIKEQLEEAAKNMVSAQPKAPIRPKLKIRFSGTGAAKIGKSDDGAVPLGSPPAPNPTDKTPG